MIYMLKMVDGIHRKPPGQTKVHLVRAIVVGEDSPSFLRLLPMTLG